MQTETQAAPVSKKMIWTGRIISALPVLMMLFGGVYTLVNPVAVQEGMKQMGYPERYALRIVIVEMACALVYASAFGINVALCLLLIPYSGAIGAAIAIATALIVETVSLALVARHKLGFNVFIWGRRA